MLAPTLDFHTAFGMTALSGWSMVGLLWALGHSFKRQGLGWMMASVFMFGTSYAFFSLSKAMPFLTAMSLGYASIGFGSAFVALGFNRFCGRPWGGLDAYLLALPVLFWVLAAVLAGDDFVLRARLNNFGFVVQMSHFATLLWLRRRAFSGNGWKVMLVAVVLQMLSVLPLVLAGRTAGPAGTQGASWIVTLTPWIICMVMFLNLQLSVLAFLMMLQDRRTQQERLAAEVDVLTRLPNRRSLERRLADWQWSDAQRSLSVAILLLDIDHFKQVNDGLGHAAGDKVLQHVAQLLSQQIRTEQLLARYGGEEFVVVMPAADETAATRLAMRLVEAVANAPIRMGGGEQRVTISVGVHVHRLPLVPQGSPAPNWSALIRRADIAMYVAKRAGRNRYAVLGDEPVEPLWLA